MKQLTLSIAILACLISCKKIPERELIDVDLISINELPTQGNNNIYYVPYKPNIALAFSYVSDYGLDSVHIRHIKGYVNRIVGIDEGRLDNVPAQGSKKGNFIYNFNTAEQSSHTGVGGAETSEVFRLVFTNEVGTIVTKQLTIKIQ